MVIAVADLDGTLSGCGWMQDSGISIDVAASKGAEMVTSTARCERLRT